MTLLWSCKKVVHRKPVERKKAFPLTCAIPQLRNSKRNAASFRVRLRPTKTGKRGRLFSIHADQT
jgi:hypothetical protein